MRATVNIGVLGLQGDFEAHLNALKSLPNVNAVLVRDSGELASADALILPGGESTTIGKLMVKHGLDAPIRERVRAGMPIWGTCAGLILLANDIVDSDQMRLGLLDVEVARNAFGRQIDSFESDVTIAEVGAEPIRGVFIRAPYVTRTGPGVEVLGTVRDRIVAVRSGKVLGTAFHPELTTDLRLHGFFASMVTVRESGQPNIT